MVETRKEILKLLHLAGFSEGNEEDVIDLLESQEQHLSNEDLLELGHPHTSHF